MKKNHCFLCSDTECTYPTLLALYISQAEIEWICPKIYGTIPEHQGKFSHVADSVAGLASLGWGRF